MHQPTLFPSETPVGAAALPPARTGDPATSHQAAAEITSSGARAHMCQVAYAMLVECPGSTAAELDHIYANRTGGPADGAIRKRLNDLRRSGRAEVRGRRRCSVSGKCAQIWFCDGGKVANLSREKVLPNSSIRQALAAIASDPSKQEHVTEGRAD